MSRIRFVDEKAKVQPSPGSTGFRKSAEPRQHVNHNKSDEIVGLNIYIDKLEKELAAARAEVTMRLDQIAAFNGKEHKFETALAAAQAEIATLKATLRDCETHIDHLIAVDESEMPTPSHKSNKSNVDDDKSIGLNADDDKSNASPNGRQRYPKGQEPWTLEGIKKNTWYARQAKLKQKNA